MRRKPVAAGVVIIAMTTLTPAGGTPVADQPSRPPAATPKTGSDRARVALPEEDPNFVNLVDALAERASLYRKFALGFTCRENVTTAKYDTDSTNFRKSDKVVYDYLFEEQPGGSLREVREEVVEKKGGEKTKNTDFDPQ